MYSKAALSVLILTVVSITGCRGPNEPAPLRAPGLSAPQIIGPPIGSAPGFHGNLAIRFAIPHSSQVSVWVVRGIGLGEKEVQDHESLGLFFTASGVSIRTLLNEKLSPGAYEVQWDTRDDNGKLVPEGWYRIYLRADDLLNWRDVGIPRE